MSLLWIISAGLCCFYSSCAFGFNPFTAFHSFICLPERKVDVAFTASLFAIYFHHVVLWLSCSPSDLIPFFFFFLLFPHNIYIYFFLFVFSFWKKLPTWVVKYRPRLVNMCKYMGISPYGTDAYLRYMLRKRLQWYVISFPLQVKCLLYCFSSNRYMQYIISCFFNILGLSPSN